MDVNKQNRAVYIFWIVLAEVVGALAGVLTRAGTQEYIATVIKPPLTPPGWVFPVVWSVLYFLMGAGAARVYLTPASNARSKALGVWLLQLGINFFWSIIFFNLRSFLLAFVWTMLLWGLVIWMIVLFFRVDKGAALLQLPYLIWVTFAAWLTFGVWRLNG